MQKYKSVNYWSWKNISNFTTPGSLISIADKEHLWRKSVGELATNNMI